MMDIQLRKPIKFGAWSLRLAVTLRHFAQASSLVVTKEARMATQKRCKGAA
jgi:hypothetical protein